MPPMCRHIAAACRKISVICRRNLTWSWKQRKVQIQRKQKKTGKRSKPQWFLSCMRIARRTLRIVHQNIVFALGIKALCLLLGALGIAGMWAAIFADVGVMVIAVLNATRALYTKDLTKN